MLKVVNLWGGPGCSKSTTAAELFSIMKKKGFKVELVTEIAKDMVYSEEFFAIKDQLMVFSRQHHKLWKIRDKVEWAIVDSPLPLSLIYAPKDMIYNYQMFSDILIDTFNQYENYNILLKRDLKLHPFQEYGRIQTLEESLDIDDAVLEILSAYNLPYTSVEVLTAAKDIFKGIQ